MGTSGADGRLSRADSPPPEERGHRQLPVPALAPALAARFALLPEAARLGTALVLMALLGFVDYLTGFEISFALFYLLPVSLAAWFTRRGLGMLVCVASAASWHLANSLAGETFSSPLIPYWNAATRLGFFFVVTWLLTELRRALETATSLSRIDPLTGALNLRAFRERADAELRRAKRYGRPITVAYVDLDNFKSINDTGGHSSGDEVLRTVVATARAHLREVDLVARVGGDEFVLLLPDTPAAAAEPAIERVQKHLEGEMSRSGWSVTFSIGVLCCEVVPDQVDDLLHEADQVMYSIKREGKNAIRHATRVTAAPAAGPVR